MFNELPCGLHTYNPNMSPKSMLYRIVCGWSARDNRKTINSKHSKKRQSHLATVLLVSWGRGGLVWKSKGNMSGCPLPLMSNRMTFNAFRQFQLFSRVFVVDSTFIKREFDRFSENEWELLEAQAIVLGSDERFSSDWIFFIEINSKTQESKRARRMNDFERRLPNELIQRNGCEEANSKKLVRSLKMLSGQMAISKW